MVEYIERDQVLALVVPIKGYCSKMISSWDVVHIPAADVVEVVRCKECRHWLKDVAGCTSDVGRCEFANYMVGAVGYCVYGERREKDGNEADN